MKIIEVNCRKMSDGRYTHQSRIIDIRNYNWYELEECFMNKDFKNDILQNRYSDGYGRIGSILPRFCSVKDIFVDSKCYRISCIVKTNDNCETLKLIELME